MRFLLVGLLVAAAAMSLTRAAAEETRVEITPFAGYFSGGSVDLPTNQGDVELDTQAAGDYGAFLDFRVSPESAVGLMYLRQDSELDANPLAGMGEVGLRTEFYHFEGFYEFSTEPIRPFVVASVGATRLEADGYDPDTRFSFTVGGGVRLSLGKHFGFRLEGRYFGTLVDRSQEELCADDDEDFCLVYHDGTLLNQFDAKVGVVFAF